MTKSTSAATRRIVRHPVAIAACLLLALAGCGGDGGGDESSDLVALTTSNRDATAHATAASIGALDAAGAGQINDASGDRAKALSFTGAWVPGHLLDALQRAVTQRRLRSDSIRPLASQALPPENCAIAGTVTLSVDDRDNSGSLTVGDGIGMVFANCQDDDTVVLDGQVSATMTRVTSDSSFGMRMTMQQAAQRAVNGRHEVVVNGTVQAEFDAIANSERLSLTTQGPVTSSLRTHLPYTDTVTLENGFTQVSTYDLPTALSSTTVSGRVTSATAGGSFDLRTTSPIVIGDVDPYPRSGAVAMNGSTGAMQLTAQSTSNVVIELDAGGDGTYEDRQVQTWDWLF
jgi:hypothetical protein